MKKIVSFFILSICLLGGCKLSTSESHETLPQVKISAKAYQNTTDLAEAVAPAVVGISATLKGGTSVGSGVCVAQDGYILTNAHVVNGSSNISVYLSTGETAKATNIWQDTVQDLAIIRTSASLPYLPLAENNLSVGQDIVAVGTPLSLILNHSFTKGIVSALDRTLQVDTDSGVSYMHNMIQHDASLNPGNSGGPLLNLNGEVVGINTLKISGGEGIGFAIPSQSFSSLLGTVIANPVSYETPYLGVFGFDSGIAKFNRLSSVKDGFYVLDVANSSPLKAHGLKTGMTITKINNETIHSALDLREELYKFKYGDKVLITFFDGEKSKSINITLDKNEHRQQK